MEHRQEVSKAVIQRLPRYYRNICELKAEGAQRISSRALAERMGLTASQIRQDFNCFGGFGQQGYGYNIEKLQEELGAMRPALDGNRIQEVLGIPPGRDVGAAYKFLLEVRLDEGVISEDEAEDRLRAWWTVRSDSGQ